MSSFIMPRASFECLPQSGIRMPRDYIFAADAEAIAAAFHARRGDVDDAVTVTLLLGPAMIKRCHRPADSMLKARS